MSIIGDLIKGMMVLSFFAVVQHGCSVKKMAERAMSAHMKGLTSYGEYSRTLTGSNESWTRQKKK